MYIGSGIQIVVYGADLCTRSLSTSCRYDMTKARNHTRPMLPNLTAHMISRVLSAYPMGPRKTSASVRELQQVAIASWQTTESS